MAVTYNSVPFNSNLLCKNYTTVCPSVQGDNPRTFIHVLKFPISDKGQEWYKYLESCGLLEIYIYI